MCDKCNYKELLISVQLEVNDNRMRILEAIGNNNYPLAADDIFQVLDRSNSINKVTVYRILDLLVEKGLVDRISTGGRAFYYGLAPNKHHKEHAHFYCTSCGQMECLTPESVNVDTDPLWRRFPGRIDRLEIRVDGICKNCLKKK